MEKEKAKKRKGEAVQEAAGAELDQQEVDASVKAKRKKVKEPSGNAAPSPGDKGAAVASLSKPLKKAAHARPPPKMPAQTEGNESEGDDAVAFVEPKKKGGAVAPDKEERLQAVARTGTSSGTFRCMLARIRPRQCTSQACTHESPAPSILPHPILTFGRCGESSGCGTPRDQQSR